MLKSVANAIVYAWNVVFAPRGWLYDPVSRKMRRWKEGAWDYRDATQAEISDAEWWQAMH